MTDTVLVDTNVLLDVLLARQPFVAHAQCLWTLAERGRISAVVSAVSFSNIYYIVRRLASRAQAEHAVQVVRAVFQVVPVDERIIDQAIAAHAVDFEDAIQHACAVRAGATCIVTRDEGHFAHFSLPAIAPDAFLAKIPPGA